MADAGGSEVRGHVLVHAVAEPDQDGGGEPALGLGQDTLERVARALTEAFQAPRRRVVVADHRQFGRLARGGDALGREPGLVVAVAQRAHASGPRDAVAGQEPWVGRRHGGASHR